MSTPERCFTIKIHFVSLTPSTSTDQQYTLIWCTPRRVMSLFSCQVQQCNRWKVSQQVLLLTFQHLSLCMEWPRNVHTEGTGITADNHSHVLFFLYIILLSSFCFLLHFCPWDDVASSTATTIWVHTLIWNDTHLHLIRKTKYVPALIKQWTWIFIMT